MGLRLPTFHKYIQDERRVPRAVTGVLAGMLREQSDNLLVAAEALEASLFESYVGESASRS
jgi:hypothetical protein